MPPIQRPTTAMIDEQLSRVSRQLRDKYKDRADAAEVDAAVTDEAAHFGGATVIRYIPVLVQHAVQERFRHRRPRARASA
jgi:hypothetical protein